MTTLSKWLISLVLMIAAVNLAAQHPAGPLTDEAANSASRQIKPAIIWLDVRSWAEYQLDHIEGDRRIPHTEIVDQVVELFPDKSTPIRLYCASGGRAGNAAQSLRAAGYTDIQNAGGIDQVRNVRFSESVRN